MTAMVKKGEQRVGPPEDSKYNSREFRIKFFGQKYAWTQKKCVAVTNQCVATKSGTAVKPTKYAEHKIDRNY